MNSSECPPCSTWIPKLSSSATLPRFSSSIYFLGIYTFIAFRVTRPEIQFLTKWTFTLDEKTLPSTESELVSFRLGNTLGYFSTAGNFSYKYEIPVLKNEKLAKSSISNDFFAICNEDSSFSVGK